MSSGSTDKPRSVEDFTKDIRLTDDGMLVLWGIIATRGFPTDDFGKQIVAAFREHFRLALDAYAAEQVAQARAEKREALEVARKRIAWWQQERRERRLAPTPITIESILNDLEDALRARRDKGPMTQAHDNWRERCLQAEREVAQTRMSDKILPNPNALKSGEAIPLILNRVREPHIPCSNCATRDAQIAALEAEVERLRGEFKCKASATSDPPTDCDMPFCGCDPSWQVAITSLIECGWADLAPFVALAKAADEYDKALAEAESSELDQLAPDIEERVDAAQEALRDQVAHPSVQRAVHDPN